MDVVKSFAAEKRPVLVPAPCYKITAWLLSPLHSTGVEENNELRQSLIRRLGSAIIGAIVTSSIGMLAYLVRMEFHLLFWVIIDLSLAMIRIPLIIFMLRRTKYSKIDKSLPPWSIDMFVFLGTLWSVLIGTGGLLWMCTNEPGLMVLAALAVMGTIGAQGIRSPGTPRLNCVQMCLIVAPFVVICILNHSITILYSAILIPVYLMGMISITKELHSDYIHMIVARIENRQHAYHCSLTGLPNRILFNEKLGAILNEVEPAADTCIVMFLDLDGFKSINDTYGHAAGDKLLIQVADRLRAWKEPDVVIARLGGDEFAVLGSFSEAAKTEADARCLIDVLTRPYDVGVYRDEIARVGVSIGMSTSRTKDSAASILIRADQALYDAKRAGKGIYCWHNNVVSIQHKNVRDINAVDLRMIST